MSVYAPYIRGTAITFEYDVPAVEEFRERIRSVLSRYPYLVCTVDGEAAGYAYAGLMRERTAYGWDVELSVYVDARHYGRRIGRSLYGALIELLELQNVCNFYGVVTLPNDASERLHTSLGFRRLGVFRNTGYKLGRWYDVAWYEKHIENREQAPLPIVPVGELDAAQLERILARAAQAVRRD